MPSGAYCKHGRWERFKRSARYWYLRIIRQNASPHNIALGLALGVFVGALPIIPFQTFTIIALAFVFRTNKLSAWLATCYSNLATMVPFYTFLFCIGNAVLRIEGVHFDPKKLEMMQLIETGWDVFLVMCAGGVIFGIPAAVLTYLVSLRLIRRFRILREERRARKRRTL
ncbi:MAG: DUF2062 domain-containing protein [Desulfovibrionaceae bacterium]|jgi:uncharacterized protein (TIGR03546 family)